MMDSQVAAGIGYNDAVLLLSLLYSSVDLRWEWEAFNTCRQPIHWWLLASYICVIAFRLTHVIGERFAVEGGADLESAGDFLVDLRQKDGVQRALVTFTWCVTLPVFVVSTLVGSKWFYQVVRESPSCVPTQSHLWFSGFWLVLCYISVLVYVALGVAAWVIERRVQREEQDIRLIQDGDERWGHADINRGNLSDWDSGLSPSVIRALSGESVLSKDVDSDCCCEDCAICINPLQAGDAVRRLPCGHVFHRPCVDLWLLRRADCPLCKRDVRSETK